MNNKKVVELQAYLERIYDIPFYVREQTQYDEIIYYVSPYNDMQSLFEVKIVFRQQIRIVVDIRPQKFAADMINDMFNSSLEKRALFLKTAALIINKGCKGDVYINGNKHDSFDNSLWNEKWSKFHIRFTRAPIVDDDENFDDLKLVKEWADYMICLMLSLLNVEKLEDGFVGFHEGGKKVITKNKYERNPVNRKLCIEHNGCLCKICGVDFKRVYGDIGEGFIHVHHIIPISEMGNGYCINPEVDLIPVCPNCHAMLHTTTPPLLPDELEIIIKHVKGENCGEINTDKE